MSSFSHIVITRFNVRNGDWPTDKAGKEVRTDTWMEERIRLFEHTCFPSMVHQSTKNFHWLVFMDVDTKSRFRDQLESLFSDYPHFHLKYVNGVEAFLNEMSTSVKELTHSNADFLITTRTDNDDAFHQEYLAKIQEAFNGQELSALNFPWGLQWSMAENRLFSVHNDSNPFISLVEKITPGKEILTVFHRNHRYYIELGDFDIIQVPDQFMWLQTIHESNVLNEVYGKEVDKSGLMASFHLNLKELC